MPEPDLLQNALSYIQTGQKQRARDLLLQLVEQEPRNEMAWLWLSRLIADKEDQIIALENVLTINPERQQARERLEQLKKKTKTVSAN